MPKPNLSDYKKLKFNRENVERLYNEFCKTHPDADEIVLDEVVQELVATEVVIATRLQVMQNENPQTDLVAKEAELRNKIAQKSDRVQKFYTTYKGEKRMMMLLDFQQRYADANDYRKFVSTTNSDYLLFYNAELGRKETRERKYNVVEVFDETFFNPVVNKKDFVQDHETKQGKEQCQMWQDQISSVEINVPDGIDEKLVSFAVLGEMLSKEHLLAVDKMVHTNGSTLLSPVGPEATIKMSFFENMTSYERRLNMQMIRSVIPESRQRVKELFESKNLEEIKKCMKTAATSMYEAAMAVTIGCSSFNYSTKKLKDLIEVAQNNNIKLEEIGLDERKLERINVQVNIYNLQQELEERLAELDTHMVDFILSKGTNLEADVLQNPKLNEILIETIALETLIASLNEEKNVEVNNTRKDFLNEPWVVADREFGPVEKAFAEKPYATYQYFKEKARNSKEYKDYIERGNYNTKKSILSGDIERNKHYNKDIYFGNWKVYETQIADIALEKNLKAANEYIKKIEDKKPNIHVPGKDQDIYKAAIKIRDKVDEIIKFREQERLAGADFTDHDHARMMAEKYSELKEAREDYDTLNPTVSFLPGDDFNFSTTFLGNDAMLKQFNSEETFNEKSAELNSFVAAYKSPKSLYSVDAEHIDSLKWGVSKNQHVAHFFDGNAGNMIEIDTEVEAGKDANYTQKDAYNTLSDKMTKNAFKELIVLSAKEYERGEVAGDKDYKNILRGIKAYVTAETRSSQDKAVTNLSKLISKYQKKYAGKTNDLGKKLSLDALNKVCKTLDSVNNGTLNIKPTENVLYTGEEPNDAGLGHLGIWRKVDGPLFTHEPSPNDIKQGLVNDCFMLSALAKIAKDHPEKIKESIKDNGDGTVTVRFFDTKKHPTTREITKTPVYIKVNKTVNKGINGANIYSSSSTWVQMYEKAFAEFISRPEYDQMGRYLGNRNNKGFQRLNLGFSSDFLNAFDDKLAYENTQTSFGIDGYEKDLYKVDAPKRDQYTETEKELFEFFSRTNSGEAMTVGGKTEDKARQSFMKDHGIRPNHAYALMGTFTKIENGVEKKYIQLRDPYATFEAKYNDNGELVNNTSFIGNSLSAGSNTMGTFNLELTDFLKMYNSIPGMTAEAAARFRDLDTIWFNKSKERKIQEETLAKNGNDAFINDFDVVDKSELENKDVNGVDDFEVVEEPKKNIDIIEEKMNKNQAILNKEKANEARKQKVAGIISGANNTICDPEVTADKMERRLAIIMSIHSTNEYIEQNYQKLNANEIDNLSSDISIKEAARKMNESNDFKKLISELGTEGIKKIAQDKTGEEINKAYGRLKEFVASPDLKPNIPGKVEEKKQGDVNLGAI